MAWVLAGFNAEVGSWGSEIVRSTSNPFNGAYTAQVPGGEVATIATDYVPCVPGKSYRGFAWLYATAITANDKVHVEIEWFTSAKASISSDDIKTDGPLSASSTWEEYEKIVQSPSTACFYKVRVEVDTGSGTANVDVGTLGGAPTILGFRAEVDTAAFALTSGSAVKVEFDNEIFDYGDLYDSEGGSPTHRFTALVGGIYQVDVSLILTKSGGFAGSSSAYVYLYDGTDTIVLDKQYLVAGGDGTPLKGSIPMLLEAGDYLEVYAWHNDGDTVYVYKVSGSRFSAFKVE